MKALAVRTECWEKTIGQWFAGRHRHRQLPNRRRPSSRSGAILVLTAVLMVVLIGMVAFGVDLGYVVLTRTQLQTAADAAALAGAGAAAQSKEAAEQAVYEFASLHSVGGQPIGPDQVQIRYGIWDKNARVFIPSETQCSAVEVTIRTEDRPLFFGRVLGKQFFQSEARAVATFAPRDLVLVLDFSASMCYDSRLRSISTLGRAAVENNLLEIYQSLGAPTYGNLTFEPDYITLVGRAPTRSCEPQITVKFLENEKQVYVTSTKDLSNVVVQYSDGSRYKYDNLSGTTGTFGNGIKQIEKVWVKSGCNASGEGPGYGERFERAWTSDINRVKEALGLTGVPYPYSGGSWEEYIQYVMSDFIVAQAGYCKKYGYLTWVNYLQAKRYRYAHTPDLWKTPEQPVTALKDAVDVLAAYLEENSPEDRLGLAIYTSSDGTAVLESPLTTDFQAVAQIVRHRQAGHYQAYTNISAGMEAARLELQNNARPNAKRVMVLMTDGQANRPYNPTYAKQRVLEEAYAAAAAGIPIITIALGAEADEDLMQQVAEITRGAYFRIPGGQPVSQYEEQLKEVFRTVAADRAPILVQ